MAIYQPTQDRIGVDIGDLARILQKAAVHDQMVVSLQQIGAFVNDGRISYSGDGESLISAALLQIETHEATIKNLQATIFQLKGVVN